MDASDSNDAMRIAIDALTWTLQDPQRADRLLALTGLTPETLRAQLNDRQTMAGVLAFVTAHEPDLIECARALEITPVDLEIAARTLGA